MNEKRLIDAIAFAEEIENLEIIVAGSSARWYDAQQTVLRRIAEQPTIEAYTEQDVRDAFNDGYSKGAEQPVKRGRWVRDTYGVIHCSCCWAYLKDEEFENHTFAHCYYCGARMDLEDEA